MFDFFFPSRCSRGRYVAPTHLRQQKKTPSDYRDRPPSRPHFIGFPRNRPARIISRFRWKLLFAETTSLHSRGRALRNSRSGRKSVFRGRKEAKAKKYATRVH